MIEYRLSAVDDELDDYEEGAEINVDDDMGDYGIDEEDEEDLPGTVVVPVSPPPAVIVAEVEEVSFGDAPPARKPVKKAAAKKAAPQKSAAPPQAAAKKKAPAKKAASKKVASKKAAS